MGNIGHEKWLDKLSPDPSCHNCKTNEDLVMTQTNTWRSAGKDCSEMKSEDPKSGRQKKSRINMVTR
jgi:hypothetical protein